MVPVELRACRPFAVRFSVAALAIALCVRAKLCGRGKFPKIAEAHFKHAKVKRLRDSDTMLRRFAKRTLLIPIAHALFFHSLQRSRAFGFRGTHREFAGGNGNERHPNGIREDLHGAGSQPVNTKQSGAMREKPTGHANELSQWALEYKPAQVGAQNFLPTSPNAPAPPPHAFGARGEPFPSGGSWQ